MRIVFIMIDTMRLDHLKMGGAKRDYAPELDKFAEGATFFEQQYVSSFPTAPNREDIMTGRFSFPHRGWGPLPLDAIPMAQLLKDSGYITQLICDTPHLLGTGHGYHRGFTAYNWIRGNECDYYMTKYNRPPQQQMPWDKTRVDSIHFGHPLVDLQLWIAPQLIDYEENTYVARTAATVNRWIEDNYKCKDFFLWVDTFELHEPYLPPKYLQERYCDPKYKGPLMSYPFYGYADNYSPAELQNMQGLYAGEVSLISKQLATVLRKLEDVGIYDDTFIAITSDHGTYLGEHNRAGKMFCAGPQRAKNTPWIQYDEVNRTPLIIKMPGQKRGRRVRQLVQPVDYLPTLLDLAKVKTDIKLEGYSLKPLLTGAKAAWPRKRTYSSNSIRTKWPNFWTGINTPQWSLHLGGEESDGPVLYDRRKDPNGTKNVANKNRSVVQSLGREYIQFLRDCQTDEDKIAMMEQKLPK